MQSTAVRRNELSDRIVNERAQVQRSERFDACRTWLCGTGVCNEAHVLDQTTAFVGYINI